MAGWAITATDRGILPVLAALGIVVFAACALRGQWRQGLPLGLDIWVAGGLIRLSADTSWQSIGLVAVLIVIRMAASWSSHRVAAASTP